MSQRHDENVQPYDWSARSSAAEDQAASQRKIELQAGNQNSIGNPPIQELHELFRIAYPNWKWRKWNQDSGS